MSCIRQVLGGREANPLSCLLTQAKKVTKHLQKAAGTGHGYTNTENPFGDANLTQRFVWGKKIEKQIHEGADVRDLTAKAERERQLERLVRTLFSACSATRTPPSIRMHVCSTAAWKGMQSHGICPGNVVLAWHADGRGGESESQTWRHRCASAGRPLLLAATVCSNLRRHIVMGPSAAAFPRH